MASVVQPDNDPPNGLKLVISRVPLHDGPPIKQQHTWPGTGAAVMCQGRKAVEKAS
jgi:hypothetical protein